MVAGLGAIGGVVANPTQVVENLPSSLVALGMSLGRGGGTSTRVEYGLAFRFSVQLDELSLGNWSSCSGLKYDFSPIEVRSGGDYTTVQYLANELKHPRIVLKRAVDPESSKAVQEWLQKAAHDWITQAGTAKGGKKSPSGATITLYDATNTAVASWTVNGVRPAAWSGPDLDAGSSKVAIETLELVHEGFTTKPATGQAAAPTGNATDQPAKLTLSDGSAVIHFVNTPTSMKVERTTESLALSSSDGGSTTELTSATPNTTRLSLSNLYIDNGYDGQIAEDGVDTLIDWMNKTDAANSDNKKTTTPSAGSKPASTPAGDSGTATLKAPPKLVLAWGATQMQVRLNSVSADYTRFDVDGTPLRAKVTITVILDGKTKTAKQKPTNPSSGGIPGRSAHTLTLGDSLPVMAFDRYGATARWRDIAEANGIDDPLRVRPGRRLYLPATAELGGR